MMEEILKLLKTFLSQRISFCYGNCSYLETRYWRLLQRLIFGFEFSFLMRQLTSPEIGDINHLIA
jgi:hypothetical protein